MSIAKSPKPRLRRSPEAARDNILAAAEEILVEQGPQALKLVDVAAAAGVANATVIHHFGSIDGVQAALMERMVQQLVDGIVSRSAMSTGDPATRAEAVMQILFDAFEKRGAARLAAWLELTGESRRLTTVRQAVEEVVALEMARTGVASAKIENLVMVSVLLAMGVGLFGRSLATLVGRPAGRARELAIELLRTHVAAMAETDARA